MKKIFTSAAIMATAALAAVSANANPQKAILIGYDNANSIDNFQEEAACKLFKELHADGTVLTPSTVTTTDLSQFDCIWVHIDRTGIAHGWKNLPAEFVSDEVINALKGYHQAGGNLVLTKHATQLVVPIGRIDDKFAPGIFGSGDGGAGTDVWCVQAQVGYLWGVEDAPEYDLTQYYDRRNHPIYKDLRTMDWVNGRFTYETYPLLGTGDGTEMHREDHNCMWDCNAYNAVYASEGKNVVEKFEKDNNAVILGQWGHVIDFAVAGIIEFLPTENAGGIIANGLAAYELSPRSGKNGFEDNIKQLTRNSLDYYTKGVNTVIEQVEYDATTPVQYFNLQGVEVSNDQLAPGYYVVRQGSKASRILVK